VVSHDTVMMLFSCHLDHIGVYTGCSHQCGWLRIVEELASIVGVSLVSSVFLTSAEIILVVFFVGARIIVIVSLVMLENVVPIGRVI